MPTPKKPTPRKPKSAAVTLDNPPGDENETPLRSVRLPHTPRFQVGIFGEEDEAERDEMRRIAEIIDAEGAGGGKIRIERRKATEADYSYLDEIPTENFSIDLVQKAYGGGDYKCRVFRSDGKFFKGFRFRIDHSIPSKHPLASQVGAAEHSQDIAAIIRELKDSRPQGMDMQAFLTQQNNATALMMAMMTKQQESQTQLFAAMISAMGNKGGGNDELLKMLLAERKEKPINELVETMLALRELDGGKEKGEKQGFFERLAEAAAPALGQVLASGAQAAQPAAPALPAPAAVAPAVPAAPVVAGVPHPGTFQNPPVSSNPEQNMIRMLFAQYREPLLRAGLAGQDAKAYAQQVAGFIPPNLSQAILDALSAETWFEDLFKADPRAAQIKPWLTQLRDGLIEIIAEPDEPAGDPPQV